VAYVHLVQSIIKLLLHHFVKYSSPNKANSDRLPSLMPSLQLSSRKVRPDPSFRSVTPGDPDVRWSSSGIASFWFLPGRSSLVTFVRKPFSPLPPFRRIWLLRQECKLWYPVPFGAYRIWTRQYASVPGTDFLRLWIGSGFRLPLFPKSSLQTEALGSLSAIGLNLSMNTLRRLRVTASIGVTLFPPAPALRVNGISPGRKPPQPN
jgi:hypothetical protein